MIKIIIILLIYLIYKLPHFIEPFSEHKGEKCDYPNYNSFNKSETLEALGNYPGKSIDLLYDANFKPECCPSFYTSSSGCLCDEPQNFNVIATRGGNILSQTFINTYSNKCAQQF